MRISKICPAIVPCVVALGLTAACRTEDTPAAAGDEAATQVATVETASDSVFASEPERVTLAQDRIYFTLHEHEWYARGQPLLYGNAAYQPAGMPVSASLPDMHHTGEYQGVDFYVRDGDEETILYVPVYEGYWQAFRPDTAQRGP